MITEPDLAGQDLPGLDERTARGAQGIFKRFIVIAVTLNAILALAVVSFDVADSIWATRDSLREMGELLTRTALRMRQHPGQPDHEPVQRTAEITGFPMGLVDRSGQLRFGSHPGLAAGLQQVYGGKPVTGTRFAVRASLGELSGAWVLAPYSNQHDLLVVVTRRPEDEGVLEYMTIAAGLTGLGLAISFVTMLIAANWMLRRPLNRLVAQLTGALARDVQQRRQAEERANQARLDAEAHLAFRDYLIEASAAVGIVATDSAGRVQIFNRAAERMLSMEASQLVDRISLHELEESCCPPRAEADFAPLHVAPGEELWLDSRGQVHLLEMKRNDIRDKEGKVAGLLLTFIDITERRRLEAELQLNELKLIQSAKMATLGEMATGVAHELNQPLNNMGLLTSRLQRRLANLTASEREFFQEKLDKVQQQIERAGRIIDHLRTFGRVRAQRLSAVQLRAAVEGVMVFLGEQLREHGIEVETAIPAQLPPALADEAQLEQVLLNLLVNARDALDLLPAGQPRKIRLSAEPCQLGEESGVCLRVTDSGPGMPPAVLQRVFEPFFTTKEVGRGTGLGLSISYGLVRDFGGTLEVDSEPGRGSSFCIRLREAPFDTA